MKKFLILLLILIPVFSFAGKISRNDTSFYWDYNLSPEIYHQAIVEKIISTNTLQINYQGNSHIMYLTGELEPEAINLPETDSDFSQQGQSFLQKMCPIGSKIYIAFSTKKIDSNGIIHGYIWYKVGETWILHNLSAIANGYALADKRTVYRNDYQDIFNAAEDKAKDNIRGFWKSVFENSGNVIISSSSGPVRINDVKVIGEDKYIEIINTSSSRVDLKGWKIISAVDGRSYIFDEYILKGRKKVRIYAESHGDDLVWEGLELYYYISNKIYLLNNKNARSSVYGW